ncbi:MAG: DUF2934 domain-containing protein [Acidobacteria bacterium]|nr:DUF2934 domain-containing protein [Acidobacteriota bacterium]MBS1864515.1 DUF2934 domain-containing protein [Acidobacteriota bacterium]
MNTKQSVASINKITVLTVNSAEQARRIDQAIAQRAYEIFERRGGTAWHELEDWRQAESEVRSKLCFGLTSSAEALLVGCDIARFEKDSIEIWVAPKRVTICGKPVAHKEKRANLDLHLYQGTVFRAVPLPVEVEPDGALINLRGNFLEIRLPKKHAWHEDRVRANAA